ncbi:MAG TPA: peptidylprolyl isomerase [Chryseosolibacter sp.]|nr:peptidylprolyl isomerase [Chryseosolibacter sp.]
MLSTISRVSFFSALSVCLLCCKSPDKPINKFSDEVILKIADLKDRREGDSLYLFFSHENGIYRRDAVEAFGSIQDHSAAERISKLLVMDPDASVRKAAAFALGQIQHPAIERALLEAVGKERTPEVTFEILQAYGRTTTGWKLDPSLYMDDSLKSAGLAWSIYRAGLRKKTDAQANEVARRLLNKGLSNTTRLGAAHFFARGASAFESVEKDLIAAARLDPSAEVRMAAASALGKIPSDSTLVALKGITKEEKDGRVLVNAMRALGSFPFPRVKNYLYEALSHKDVNVSIAASEVLIGKVDPGDWIEVSSLTNRVKNWRVEANLYEAALRAGKNADLVEEVKVKYAGATDPYVKAAFLGSLKAVPSEHEFVASELIKAQSPVVVTMAANTLVAMNRSEEFTDKLKPRFFRTYETLMRSSDDPAVLGTLASALADSSLGYKLIVKDFLFLSEAKKKLRLPEHNESLQPIEAAIAHFENKKAPPTRNEFNHPIDWALVKRIPEDQLATIKTTRGSIVIRLLVNDSPGSVGNFIDLARKNYFDNKFFHRVVPNFVVQAGCSRGDGWGGEDYSIRSEFAPRVYQTGSVGMASAGKDTEGTQWFITHSPTPHLDGRYTIFAEVTEGMGVLDFLQVGDKIVDVEITDFPAQ